MSDFWEHYLYYTRQMYTIIVAIESMGWELINGRRYFYETTYDCGERIRHCHGHGIEAHEAAARVEKEKLQQAEELAVIREWETVDQVIERKNRQYDAWVRAEIERHLADAGYHQHKGTWRKRRKSNGFDSLGSPISKHEKEGLGSPISLAREISRKKRKKREEAASERSLGFLGEFRKSCQMVQPVNDPEGFCREIRTLVLDQLQHVGGTGEMRCDIEKSTKDALAYVSELRESLQYDLSSDLERIVIEQLVTAWVQWYVTGWQVGGEACWSRTPRQNEYVDLRYARSQLRYTQAIDRLVRLRCIPRGKFGRGN